METVFRTTSSYRSINDRMTISPENPASFFSTAFISILWLCRSKHATISCLVVHYYMKIELYHENSHYILTSATKNRATTFPNWMAGNCIPVFLMAMHSAKWFIADRIPKNVEWVPLAQDEPSTYQTFPRPIGEKN